MFLIAGVSAAGPRSSALVGGYTSDHRDLETQLHTLKETEDALLFPSGFAANQVRLFPLLLMATPCSMSDTLSKFSDCPQYLE